MLILYIFGIFIFISCSSTKIISNWREPNKEISINKLNKVVVVVIFKGDISRPLKIIFFQLRGRNYLDRR